MTTLLHPCGINVYNMIIHLFSGALWYHLIKKLLARWSNSTRAIDLFSVISLPYKHSGIYATFFGHEPNISFTRSQCTLASPVYTGMPLECHWLTQCTLGYHWATQRILAGYTGTPLEKLSWNSPTLECHWRNFVESAPHWDATGETLTFAAYTETPLGGTVTAHTRPDT